jgi:hypothetical protein
MLMPAMPSAEARLVFRTADPRFGDAECAATVAAVQDWERVLAITERESATAAVWRAIRASAAAVPDNVNQAMRARALQRDLRMQRLSQRLGSTIAHFAARGIPVMLLKGAAYAAYFDPTLRSRAMNDVDLLVRPEDAARAREAVIAAGWPETRDPGLLELLKDAHHLPHFVDPQDPDSRVELHVALMPADQPFALTEGDIWRDARPATGAFTGAYLPSPEHLLLHACVHFAWQHTMAFGAWKTIRIVEAVAADPRTFDWRRFEDLSRAAHAGTCVFWTLRLTQRLSGIRVPEETMARLAPPTPEFALAALERHFVAMIAVGEGPRSPSVKLTRLLWRVALRPRWSGHVAAGRSDPENRWATTYGVGNTETRAERISRHFRGLRAWWEFVVGTLSPRGSGR